MQNNFYLHTEWTFLDKVCSSIFKSNAILHVNDA